MRSLFSLKRSASTSAICPARARARSEEQHFRELAALLVDTDVHDLTTQGPAAPDVWSTGSRNSSTAAANFPICSAPSYFSHVAARVS